jgi:hypothetical protein
VNSAPLIYDISNAGHRARDAEVLSQVLDGTVLFVAPKRALRRLLSHAGPLVWQTADYAVVWFTLVAALRTLLGRRTVGICYRNGRTAYGKSRRRIIRKILFRMWNMFPFCTALTTSVPVFAERSSTFMYDVEWWDLTAAPLPVVSLPTLPSPGKTLMFLGDVSEWKGTDFFVDCAMEAAARKSDWRFVMVGAVEKLSPAQRARLSDAGATIIAGPKDDAAFVSYMRQADMLWCCYSPFYDQTSGIFGRALQLNKASVVRKESLLHEYQQKYGCGVAVAFGDAPGFLSQLERPMVACVPSEETAHMYDQASRRLRAACGWRDPTKSM